ncbi:MAG: hypothetical protein AAF211_24210, partial [Myxococcota bacterium]
DRPDYRTVASTVRTLFRHIPWPPDLPSLGRSFVEPALAEQAEQRVHEHPAYEDLRFIEGGAQAEATLESTGDRRLRELLAKPHWSERSSELRAILLEDPGWTAQPWAELLDGMRDRGFLSWLMGPSHDGLDRDKVAFALQMVARRPDPELGPRLRWLRRHQDPEIRDLAIRVLDREP